MKFLGIIPARYASTRFPAKLLAKLGSKPVIQRVYEQVKCCFEELYVATDDVRIYNTVKDFGGNAIMTSGDCKSGTDRCCDAYEKLKLNFDVVVNVQGDEPFIQPRQIELLKSGFNSPETDIATLVKPFSGEDGYKKLLNENSPKVVIDKFGHALYFSRSVIPFVRGCETSQWLSKHIFYKHLGVYAYKTDVLKSITQLPQSELEIAESLEQLRWLENGYTIKVGITDIETIGIDTPEDLQQAREFARELGLDWD